jgi:hypothetical protein
MSESRYTIDMSESRDTTMPVAQCVASESRRTSESRRAPGADN